MFSKEDFDNFMNQIEHTTIVNDLIPVLHQNYPRIIEYLNNQKWKLEDLEESTNIERRNPFQRAAENYFRFSGGWTIFLQYSKQLYEIWYQNFLRNQEKENKRMHKGMPLHQIGFIYEELRDMSKAWKYYLAAFVEDSISHQEIAKDLPAYRALDRFGFSGELATTTVSELRKFKGKEGYNPLDIVILFNTRFIVPSYEEISSVDRIRFEEARKLWEELKQKVEKTKK